MIRLGTFAADFGAAADRNFRFLWLATCISTFGTVLMLMAVALHVFHDKDSSLAMAAVYASQWFMPIFFTRQIGEACRRWPAARLLVHSLSASAVVTLAVGFASSLPVSMALLLMRGLLEALTKSATVIALRKQIRKELLDQAVSSFDTSRYVAGGAGALGAALLIGHVDLPVIAIVDAMTFLAAAYCCKQLVERHAPAMAPLASGAQPNSDFWSLLRENRPLRNVLAQLTAAVACFQGFHGAARTALPLLQLRGNGVALGWIQATSSLAFIVGALFATRWFAGRNPGHRWQVWLVIATCACMCMSTISRQLSIAVVFYFAFLVLYELLYVQLNKALILDCTEAQLPVLASMRATFGTAGMVVVTLVSGMLMDLIGYPLATAVIAVASGGVLLALLRISESR